MDIGAISPGGNSPGATEICREGIRIPGIKLVDRGELRKDLFDAFINMTRQPVMVGLDLKCEIAANNVAKSRMRALYEQFGPELVTAVSQEMLHYSEAILRRRIAEIPDGTWSDTGSIHAGDTWKVQLTLNKKDDRLLFDFTGSSPQAKKGINLPYHATFGACYEAILCTLAYDLPKNHGALKPIEVIAKAAKQPMVLESVDLGPLGAEDVEVAVEHRGLYHSDLSVLNNEWGISQYPAILGHEVVGRVTGVGTPNPRPLDAPVTMATSFYWYSHS